MESVLPALGLTPTVSGVVTGMKYATYIGKKSYDLTKFVTGGRTGTRELSQGIVKKGLTGSGVGQLVGSNKVVVGSAKNFAENKSMPNPVTPPRTPAGKRKATTNLSKTRKNKKQRKKAQKVMANVVKKIVSGVSVGKAAGKMRKSKKSTKSMVKFGQLGYTVSANLVGTVIDPQVVYLHHNTFDVGGIARTIVGALLRKLFKKAGIDIGNENDELPLRDNYNSDDFQIVFIQKDIAGLVWTPFEYPIPANTTFKSLLDALCGGGGTPYFEMIAFMDGANQKVPNSLALNIRDKWVTPAGVEAFVYRTHTVLNLQNERIVFYGRSKLTVQNRTKGSNASGTDYSDQRIDNQPLEGKLYDFTNGDPRLKKSQLTGTGVTNEYDFLLDTGSAFVRAFGAVVFPANYMDDIPSGKLWKNVKKSSNVLIQPGDIKHTQIEVNYDLPLLELLLKFRVLYKTTVSGEVCFTGLKSHKSQFLILKEILRTPADNFITIQYENEKMFGAYSYSKKSKSFFRSQNYESTITQWVPPV